MRKKRKVLLLVVLGALASASAAYAFSQLTGLSGSTTGNITGNVQTLPALVVASAGQPPDLDSGQTVTAPITITNNATVGEQIANTPTFTFTTKNSGGSDNSATCASSLSYQGESGGATWLTPASHTFSPGSVTPTSIKIALAANAPIACAGGSWTVAIAATTNP